jgi:malate dehydrogenase (oxaloacetate-decarboxylating)
MGSARTGNDLLECPLQNRGTAFTEAQRKRLGLLGLLPPNVETLKEQVQRSYEAYRTKTTGMGRHIFLRNLQDTNETLFYRLLTDHLTEMTPIIYTPVVGAACQRFSEIYRRARGLFIAYPERDCIDEMLDNAIVQNVRVIVVTDGERILGLGDQGAGGMGIPIGKLSLYTACGGIDPSMTLPVILDVGTNNEERLADPLYIGWRHKRISGQDYFDFLDMFVQAVKRKWPDVLLQFEDFAQTHAAPLLERYRDQLCTFNDDIQGTAAVTVGTLLSAVKVAGERLCDQNVAFLGAGSAGCGIAEQMIAAMVREGVTGPEARSRFYMVDRQGLLHDGMADLLPFQQKLLQPHERVKGWASDAGGAIGLLDVVQQAKPAILVGVSAQPGLFTEEIVRTMASYAERPMIFPMSNPTSRAEAVPEDLIRWTDGKALVATGSPFEPVNYNGRSYPIAQSNNSYIFPGMGLGILAVNARRVSDEMFMAASVVLSECSPALADPQAALLPSLEGIRNVSRKIALAVARQAQAEGLAGQTTAEELEQRIDATVWEPEYSSST